MVSNDEKPPAPQTVIRFTHEAIAAIAQLHLWFSVGLEEIHKAFEEGDTDRAMVLCRMLFEHECMERDRVMVDDFARQVFSGMFEIDYLQRAAHLRQQLLSQAAEVQAAADSPEVATIVAMRRRGDLPS